MIDRLFPEELLREVLSHNISVKYADFVAYRRPFGMQPDDRESERDRNGHLLLVSKRWLRIGTPLLYECLQLRTPEHTTTVAEFFRTHPFLGLCVRCLRLEGGLGKDLARVTKFIPKVHTIYFSLKIKSSHSVTGLKKALPLLQPSALYIQEETHRDNKKISEARSILHSCIHRNWISLKSVSLSEFSSLMLTRGLADAIARSSVEEFSSDACDVVHWIEDGTIHKILRSPWLKRIECRGNKSKFTIQKLFQEKQVPAEEVRRFSFVPGWRDDFLQMVLSDDSDEDWD